MHSNPLLKNKGSTMNGRLLTNDELSNIAFFSSDIVHVRHSRFKKKISNMAL